MQIQNALVHWREVRFIVTTANGHRRTRRYSGGNRGDLRARDRGVAERMRSEVTKDSVCALSRGVCGCAAKL